MASNSMHGLKRPHPADHDADTVQKRPRSNNGSPAPQMNGAPLKQNASEIMAQARAKAAAIAARLQGAKSAANGIPQAAPTPEPTPTLNASALSRVEQMKARIAAATAKASLSTQRPTAPAASTFQPPVFDDSPVRARGGLDVGLHPALMGDSNQDVRSTKSRQTIQPKFATTMANRRTDSPLPTQSRKGKRQLDLSGPSIEETKSNPYFDPSLGAKTAVAKGRNPRQLIFNQKGKYIQQAIALRRQVMLEAMKKKIAEDSRKAGIDEDLDTEKAFLVQAPPDIEWWDEGLVKGSDYSDLNPTGLKIDTPDSIVTKYIQHPVPIEPPQEKNMPAPRPLFLTPKENAKKRRQRRMAELKEQQAKIRLGLVPAPPPKVKKSNLMRVLGEEAVKDPTAVEARVNREIAERHQTHLEANEDRKLTKDQRHDKVAEQQSSDASLGIYATVYKIDNLSNGRHRFKIHKNAEQNALTGICILHPKFCLVIVEGGRHSISNYKKLMLNRIDWTENLGPNPTREGNKEALAAWIDAEDEQGILKDLSLNQCTLVWEGEQKQRSFRKWLTRKCETDKEARDALSRAHMDSFWTLAKSMGSGQPV